MPQRRLGDLTESEDHLSGLELQGHARIETPDARPGELKLMAGDIINLTYYENTEVVQSAIVTDNTCFASQEKRAPPNACFTPRMSSSGWRPTAQRSRH